MDWKLFFSTFVLIFLAELGDKTQLASLAASAGSKSPWSVFIGASLALVLSTLLAILLGSIIQRLVPIKVIKLSAALLFFLFGALLLFSALTAKESVSKTRFTPSQKGLLVKLVLKIAGSFEADAAKTYSKLSLSTTDPAQKQLFTRLAQWEKDHLKNIKTLKKAHLDTIIPLNNQTIFTHNSTQLAPLKNSTIKELIAHEEATAAFYRELARTSHIPGLKTIFEGLAQEEDAHQKLLREADFS